MYNFTHMQWTRCWCSELPSWCWSISIWENERNTALLGLSDKNWTQDGHWPEWWRPATVMYAAEVSA